MPTKKEEKKIVKKIKKLKPHHLFRFKYPKLFIFVLCIILAYFIFSNSLIKDKIFHLENLSYLGVFIAGFFFSFGFTTPFAIGFFLASQPPSIFLAAILGGFGALLADLFIFKLIKITFYDEFKKIERTKTFKEIDGFYRLLFKRKIRHYLTFIFAGIIIASPLPDEIGVALLAGATKISPFIFAVISFLFNFTGIFLILLLSSL